MIFSYSFPLHLSRQTTPLFVIVYLVTARWRFVVTQFGCSGLSQSGAAGIPCQAGAGREQQPGQLIPGLKCCLFEGNNKLLLL